MRYVLSPVTHAALSIYAAVCIPNDVVCAMLMNLTRCGCRAVMCYLQVVGEQHALVEQHMSSFTALLAELQRSHMLHMGEVRMQWWHGQHPHHMSCCR